jgi:hypothetical protein
MLRLLKQFSWVALLGVSFQSAWGFALLGPINEAYQVPVIGYNLPGDIGAPKNYAQEYRRNTPVMYYTIDPTFADYFGTSGIDAVDQAFGIFSSLPKASAMSQDLSEYPLQMMRKNMLAESLYLWDLKSMTMMLIIENLGLAQPDRYTWTLHDRYLPSGATCPYGEEYLVIKRNFDPAIGVSVDQLKPTSYVNGTLYTYELPEYCNAPLPPQAWCEPVPVDQVARDFSSVAGVFGNANTFVQSPYGAYFMGLTRDDVGGLRYLLSTNNMNVESAGGTNTLALLTNTMPQLLMTSNLTLLALQALTNDAPTLAALYPGLQVAANPSNYPVNVYTTNVVAYYTNSPNSPAGIATLAYSTNVTANAVLWYYHTFFNAMLLSNTPTGWVALPMANLPGTNGYSWVTMQTVTVGVSNNPYGSYGATLLTTNTYTTTYQTNAIVGDFVIMPTNMCQMAILWSQLTNVVSYTNSITATNALANTNQVGTPLQFTQNQITYFTNHTFWIDPIVCQSSNVSLYQGIDHITFIRRDYDSLLSRYFYPITNEYTLNSVVSNSVVPQRIQRILNAPDFLIEAADLSAGPDQLLTVNAMARNIRFNTNNAYLAGPGTIEGTPGGNAPGTTITYNNVGPIFALTGLVDTNAFLTEMDEIPLLAWGSFDGSTNTVVVYPNDVSIGDLQNQVLIQVSPPYLADGAVGYAYNAQLQTAGSTPNWTAPYYWSLAPGSPGLPPGLAITTISSNGGLIYGTPTQDGFYDFTLRVIDKWGRVVDRSYSIKINPHL